MPTEPTERITKKKLTVTEAAEQWKAADAAIADAKPLQAEARAVLVAHMEKRKITKFRGIQLVASGGNLILDQAKVIEYLGAKVAEFQKRSATSKSLKRLS